MSGVEAPAVLLLSAQNFMGDLPFVVSPSRTPTIPPEHVTAAPPEAGLGPSVCLPTAAGRLRSPG